MSFGTKAGMTDPKLLISVQHCLKEPWLSIFQDGSQVTWNSMKLPPGMDIVHFHGQQLSKFWDIWDSVHEKIRWSNRWLAGPLRWFDMLIGFIFLDKIPSVHVSNQLKINQTVMEVHCKDTYQFLRWKDLAILKHFVEETVADYLFMTTNNSYIDFDALGSLIKTLPKSSLYAGVKAYDGATFAAGNNRILSRDVAVAMLKNRRSFSAGYIEDVAMGRLATKLGVNFQELGSLVLGTLEELQATNDATLMANYHFRVKSGSLNSRNDVEIMLALHNRIRAVKLR